MDGSFSPLNRESRWFDDFHLGERFSLPPRTLTDAMCADFAALSGEIHPLHTDPGYCQARGRAGIIAHGFLVLAQTVAGAGLFPFLAEDALIGLTEQSSRFMRDAQGGDTLTPVLWVDELAPAASTGVVALRSTVHNQRKELVMEGMQRWLLRRRLG